MKHKTTREIRKALCTLLLQKEIEKITVAEICAEAEINRGTFYRYYHDIYEVREEVEDGIVQELYKQAVEMIDEQESSEKVFAVYLSSIRENRQLLRALIFHAHSQFAKKISEMLLKYAENNHLFKENSAIAAKKYTYYYLTGGIASVIFTWGKNDFQESPEIIAHIIVELSENTLKQEI